MLKKPLGWLRLLLFPRPVNPAGGRAYPPAGPPTGRGMKRNRTEYHREWRKLNPEKHRAACVAYRERMKATRPEEWRERQRQNKQRWRAKKHIPAIIAMSLFICMSGCRPAHAAENPELVRKWSMEVNDDGSVYVDCEAESHFCEASSNHPTPWRKEQWFQRAPVVEFEKDDEGK